MRPRSALGAWGGAILLSACGGPQEADKQPTAAEAGQESAVSAPSETPNSRSNAEAGLRADVSPLAGAVSDLSVRVTDLSTIVSLPADVLFEFDKATLTPAAEQSLRSVADLVRQGAPGAVTVLGHTDGKGSDAYNEDLSERRAEAVAEWFARQPGVRDRDYRTEGKGEREPVAPNTRPDGGDNPQGRAQNRRVEVVIPR